jgi:hypothetical protein
MLKTTNHCQWSDTVSPETPTRAIFSTRLELPYMNSSSTEEKDATPMGVIDSLPQHACQALVPSLYKDPALGLWYSTDSATNSL